MTINPTSLKVNQLLGASIEQYVVPAYQRRYSWREKQLQELLDDVSQIDGNETHLLGTIVCLTGQYTAGINKLELVDGQQRLTTLTILLQCIRERLAKEGQNDESQEIARLLTARCMGGPPVRKVVLDSLDAAQFEELLEGGSVTTSDNRNLTDAFAKFRNWALGMSLDELNQFLFRLTNQSLVIRLEVGEAINAFKLFETINNRGLSLSPTDIIKNFILGNAARFGGDSLGLAKKRWAELIKHLDGVSTEAFFRHYLAARNRRRITKSYVIANFKSEFMRGIVEAENLPEVKLADVLGDSDDDDVAEDSEIENETEEREAEESQGQSGNPKIPFAKFLEHLILCAKHYRQIVLAKTGSTQIDRRLRNLRMIKSMQANGFLMHLRVEGCPDDTFASVLKLTEAFLLRRHICRQRSNENEFAFARLCGISDCKNPIAEVSVVYREYSPTDERFQEEFASTNFSGGLIDRARYCLEQFELTLQGDYGEVYVADASTVQVEHIIPQKIKSKPAKAEFGDWVTYLGSNAESRHPKYVGRIGNLTLFAGELNLAATNNPFAKKKSPYGKSAIKLTNTIPGNFPDFRFSQVEKRSQALAELAVRLWPIP